MSKSDPSIDNIYPLTPMQEGILFHALYNETPGIYVNQLSCRLAGALNVRGFQQVWAELVDRHPALRTGLVSTERGRWLQVVYGNVEPTWEMFDWQGLSEEGLSGRLAEWLDADRRRGLEVDRVPMMRLTLIQLRGGEYQFIWSYHHALLDGWSISIIIQEAFELYAAELGSQQIDRSPTRPYSDFLVWRQSKPEAEGERYWRELLSGLTTPTSSCVERPRRERQAPPTPSYEEVCLSANQTSALEQLAAAHRVTLSTIFHAMWGLLLSRYSGEREIVFGSSVAGRPPDLPGSDQMVGLFINTLPIILRIAPQETGIQLLQQMQAQQLASQQFEYVPLSTIQACSVIPPGTALFNTIVVFENYPAAAKQLLRSLKVDDIRYHEMTNYDITVVVVPGNRLSLRFQYDLNQHEAETIRRMLDAYQQLLNQIAASPSQPIHEFSLTGDAQVKNLPRQEGCLALPWDPKCIHQLFELQAERTPHATAVVFNGQRMTYAELNGKANRLARYLRSLDVGPEVRVALCMERGLGVPVTILGILKAGGVYVPLDPEYPSERLAFMLADMGATILLTEDQLLPRIPKHEARTVCWQASGADLEVDAVSNPENLTSPQNMAYMIYTSGSTGQPKGVMVTHENVTRLLAATSSSFRFGPSDTWTLFHSLSFDFSVWELWGALLYGGRLVVVPHDASRSPTAMYELMQKEGVTIYNQTPSSFLQLVRWIDSFADRPPLKLRTVIFGGEALDIGALGPWTRIYGDECPQLVNMYGITETTVHVTEKRISQAEIAGRAGSLIGLPISDMRVYVVDESLQLVPPGVPGEMVVSGGGVSRGYHGRPDLTAQVFVPDPYSGIPGSRLYRSADRARKLSNGGLEYLGRKDAQVKIRGHRVEPGEIRSALEQHPDVREAAVTTWEEDGHKILVAYVVLKEASTLHRFELRDYLRSKLPSYMVPASFTVLAALPLTAHGKIDYRALPAPEVGRDNRRSAPVPASTEVEGKLIQIWREVLHCGEICVHDNYFDLGGDSIRSLEIIARAKRAGIHITPKQIFECQSVHLLAKEAKAEGAAAITDAGPFNLISEEDRNKLPGEIEDAYPLTFLQRGMVLHGEVPGSACYHDIFSFHVRARLQRNVLEEVVQEVVLRHPVLRTSFNLTDFAEPMQLIHKATRSNCIFSDICHLGTAKQDAFLDEWIEGERNSSIDWTQAPLFRVYVLRRGLDTFQFIFSFHHAILDGWSVAIVLSELFLLYSHRLRGASKTLPPLRASFRQFVALEKASLNWDEASTFWRSKLEGFQARTPIQKGRHAQIRASKSAVVSAILESELCRRIEQLAGSLQVSVKYVVLAAHIKVLTNVCGHDDIVTGVVLHGRQEEEDASRAVGLFLNTVPMFVKARAGSWRSLIRQVMDAELEYMPYRRFPTAEMCHSLKGAAPFDCVFIFNHFHIYRDLKRIPGIEVLGSHVFEQTNFPLGVNFTLDPDSPVLTLQLNYDTSQFSREQVQRRIDYYRQALKAMAAAPDSEYHLTSLLTEAEQRQVELEWNNTAADLPEQLTLHSWFEIQAAKTPAARAIRSKSGQLTYDELESRANQLAQVLRQKGLGPDQVVGVWLTRDIPMIVCLLAILKAGGAYLPLDPAFPQERVQFILKDSQAALLVTQGRVGSGFNSPCPVIDLHLIQNELALCPKRNASAKVDPDNLAYVTYTSGSTGEPKGVMIDHRGICNTLRWRQTAFGLSPADRILQNISLTFDPSTWQIFGALVTGCELVLASQDGGHAIPDLASMIERYQITVTDFVPSLLRLFLDEADLEQCRSLKKVFCGGEALTTRITEKFLDSIPAELYNMYGPTEACIDTTWWKCSTADPALVPIGKPISNKKIYVLDQHQMPVPSGASGELYIGGIGLARGYRNQPALTAERFIPDLFGRSGGRLYRTGDLVRFREDGVVEYLGRVDGQVKVHGARIELGEIEHALAKHPAVRDCVVVPHGDPGSEQKLVAYVASDQANLSDSSLRDFLSDLMPPYMVPSRYVCLQSLPLNRHGKVDVSALPEPSIRNDGQEVARVAPRTALEEHVASIWRSVLQREDVGVHDNFFDLGGHSLAMLQVHSKLRKSLDRELSIVDLFRLPTIEALAGHLTGKVDDTKPWFQQTVARARGTGTALQLRRAHRQSKRQVQEGEWQ